MNSRKLASQASNIIVYTFYRHLFATIHSLQAPPPALSSHFRTALDKPNHPRLPSQSLLLPSTFRSNSCQHCHPRTPCRLYRLHWREPDALPLLFLLTQNPLAFSQHEELQRLAQCLRLQFDLLSSGPATNALAQLVPGARHHQPPILLWMLHKHVKKKKSVEAKTKKTSKTSKQAKSVLGNI